LFCVREWNRTLGAVQRQIEAMGAEVFEVGLFKPDARDGEAIMLPRVWDRDALLRSVPWLRYENRNGRNIYVRPSGEHNLSLVDDLTRGGIVEMKRSGFSPTLIVETSPGNFQAWVKHPHKLDSELGTVVARALAERFGGDTGAADWRHYGRLAGFANRKEKYRNPATGLHPFVKVSEAYGSVYPAAEEFLGRISLSLEERRQKDRQRGIASVSGCAQAPPVGLKSIESFRSDLKYGGDVKRADLAYAVYALSRGQAEIDVEAAIRSRDLSHKGNERRQRDYVERTIRKAAAASERGRCR
jgi:hypothetical protein